jgi:hypothetical protein
VEDLQLLQLVRVVAALADPDDPQSVSQRVWDAARVQLADEAGPTSARSIARSLRRPWPEVVELAHLSKPKQNKRLGQKGAARAQEWLTIEHVAYVLKLVARRSNKGTITTARYEVERKKMIEANWRYYMHGRRLRMPTAAQIRTFTQREIYGAIGPGVSKAGTWERALEFAGLGSATGIGSSAVDHRPSSRGRRDLPAPRELPLPLLDLLDRYYAAHGVEPTPTRLWGFAKENELPYSMTSSKKAWSAVIAVWRRRRSAARLPAPAPPEPTTPGENALAHFRASKKPQKTKTTAWSDPEKCLHAIIAYVEALSAGERATSIGYSAWASQHCGQAPSLYALKKHGGWSKMIEAAHQRMLAQMATAAAGDRAGERENQA